MLDSIIDLASSVLPSVSKEKVDEAKKAILQFEIDGKEFSFLTAPLKEISQGDIIERLPFYFIDSKTGGIQTWVSPGMVLSTSCNIDNNEYVLVAPLVKVDETHEGSALRDLRKNVVFDYMYLKAIDGDEYYADFNKTMSFPVELLNREDANTTVKRSLTQIGYYLFLIKLTVFLMREEDVDTRNSREKQ